MSTEFVSYDLTTTVSNYTGLNSSSVTHVIEPLTSAVLQNFKVPSFRQKIANLESATSPFLAVSQSMALQSGTMYLHTASGGKASQWSHTTLSGPQVGGIHPPVLSGQTPATEAQAISNAKVDFLANLYKAQAVFAGGTFLGELKETLLMFRRNLLRVHDWNLDYLRNAIKALGRAHNRARLAKDVSGLYLEWAYGWKPLLSDLEDAIKACTELAKRPKVKFILGEGSSSKLLSSNSTLYNTSGIYWIRNVREDMRTYSKFSGVMKCQMAIDAAYLRHLFGFDPLRDFFPTIWNLIPYSFLVDYYVSVGDFVAGTFADTSSLAWVSATQVTSSQKTVGGQVDVGRTAGNYGIHFVTAGGSPGVGVMSAKRVKRINPDLSLEVWDMHFDYPRLFSGHWWNEMFLALNKLSRRYQKLLKQRWRDERSAEGL